MVIGPDVEKRRTSHVLPTLGTPESAISTARLGDLAKRGKRIRPDAQEPRVINDRVITCRQGGILSRTPTRYLRQAEI